jgi:hypothetical protein
MKIILSEAFVTFSFSVHTFARMITKFVRTDRECGVTREAMYVFFRQALIVCKKVLNVSS